MKKITTLLLVLVVATAHAQTLTDFTLKNVLEGKDVSLTNFTSAPGMVVLFTSVACPFDGYYTKRLVQVQNEYKDKLPILLVNSYTEAPEAEEWMVKAASANGLTLPYLSDKEQVLMTQLKAQRSPEVFVLKNTAGQFTVMYRGALDDNAQVEAEVKQTYLKDAIEALLAGKNVTAPATRTVGCYIRKK